MVNASCADPYADLPDDVDPSTRPLGQVPTTGRGSLPFATLDGEPLVALASFALEDAGVELLDFTTAFAAVRDAERPLVLHDPLCPLTPIPFLRKAIALALTDDVVVVGVQPVTDTIKTAPGGVVGETIDREELWTVTSPVVLPAAVVAELDDWPDTDDFPALVTQLRERAEVRFVESPALARRVEDETSLKLLEALAAGENPQAAQA